MKLNWILLNSLLVTLAVGSVAQAGVSVANGDFESDAVQTTDVTDWFNSRYSSTWWDGAWAGPNVSPNGTCVLGLGYENSSVNWAYQRLGVNDGGFSALEINYDVGSFTDAPSSRDLGVMFSVYAVTGSFVAGGADIKRASGVQLIDSVSVMHSNVPVGEMRTGLVTYLDLSGTEGQDLYLRVSNYMGEAGEPWVALDNLSASGSTLRVLKPGTYIVR